MTDATPPPTFPPLPSATPQTPDPKLKRIVAASCALALCAAAAWQYAGLQGAREEHADLETRQSELARRAALTAQTLHTLQRENARNANPVRQRNLAFLDAEKKRLGDGLAQIEERVQKELAEIAGREAALQAEIAALQPPATSPQQPPANTTANPTVQP